MQRAASDKPGPGQDMAREIIGWAAELYKQGNTLSTRRFSGHMGVVGNEIADIYAKAAVRERTPDTESRKEMKRISLSFLNSGKGQKRWGGTFRSSTKESQPSTYPACPNPKPKIRNRAPKYAESHSQPPISALKRTYTHIPLPEREMEMHGLRFLLVVQRRQKTRENPYKERREREGKSTLCGKGRGTFRGGAKAKGETDPICGIAGKASDTM